MPWSDEARLRSKMRDYKNYRAGSETKWELVYWCLLGIFVLTIFLHVLDEVGL